MCLLTTNKPSKIKKPITCYKIMFLVDGILKNAYYHVQHEYELNKLYTTELGIRNDISSRYNVGSFDWKDGEALDITMRAKELTTFTVVNAGFHATLSIERLHKHGWESTDVLVECTIPAGSTILKDHSGLIVSNQIILNKIIKR